MKFADCIICSKVFKIKPGCKGIYCSIFCSEKDKSSRSKERARKELKLKTEQYHLNPKFCKCCDTRIKYENRNNQFCNLSCSAIYNNTGRKKSTETKKKLSNYAKLNPKGFVLDKPKINKPFPKGSDHVVDDFIVDDNYKGFIYFFK